MFKCNYCGRSFAKESTLAIHMCEQKRRYMQKDEKHVQLGFRSYQLFYRIGTNTKNDKTYEDFGKKVKVIRENVKKNISNLKSNVKKLIGYGSPAKATTALNFFGISKEIDFIVEDNKLKQGKFVPGVKIPINSKKKVISKNNNMLVLAWNFFKDIKKIIKISQIILLI